MPKSELEKEAARKKLEDAKNKALIKMLKSSKDKKKSKVGEYPEDIIE